MTPAYGPVTWEWIAELVLVWGSWLAWPLLAWVGWRLARGWRTAGAARRGAGIGVLAMLLVFVEMRFVEPALIVERTTPLRLGFKARIAVISDYHLGLQNGPAFLQRVVDRLNALPLDAVLIAGDHLSEPDRPVAELLAPLRSLRHPAYSVPGNHDEGHPGPLIQAELRRVLEAAGVTPVEYTHVVLPKFILVGIGDHYAGKDSVAPLQDSPRDRPRLVLMHNPDSAMNLPKGSAALAIAGHTHGGQIRIPRLYWNWIPCKFDFDRGLHDFAPVPVFVTSGLGQAQLPMRFLNPPVIDVLEIR